MSLEKGYVVDAQNITSTNENDQGNTVWYIRQSSCIVVF